jgi:hypothetical protein
MIQKFKDELQIIFGLHHQQSINHEYFKCSLMGIFILVKDESNTLILALWHCIWPLKFI